MSGGRIFFFFFFKQKTAYEIVDCDWSSDVCSSDLRESVVLLDPKAFQAKKVPVVLKDPKETRVIPVTQIGRASCRERV